MAARVIPPLSLARVWTCILINVGATPGLGSLMARRFFAGTGQLLLAVAGFLLIIGWMLKYFYAIFQQQLGGNVSPHLPDWMWQRGLMLFGAGWLWSLSTSIGLWRQAKGRERSGHQNVPPTL